MNFKQIEMVGFKSFADPIKLTFSEGITAIVGPNGCGKSNVADAIRWVLGEQSSKNLRGTSMQDVIFKGTEKRKSLSFCEVSLCFDNSNKIFRSDFEEIVITRKLYRSGESEYMINRATCRLKDIIDMLHDSGIGKSGYSIIGQGKVEEIINSKPEDRRAIFEEAAGIAKFKSKKIESERKLDRTRDNLIRINDIISEIDRQLTPLKKQSDNAKIYLDLKEKLKNLEINAYIHQYDYASTNKQEIQLKIDGILEEMQLRQDEYDKTNESYNDIFNEVNNIDNVISTLRDKQLELTVNIEKQTGERNLILERLKNYESEKSRLTDEHAVWQEKLTQLNDELYNTETAIKNKQNTLYVSSNKIHELSEKYEKISHELSLGENEAEETQKRIIDTLSKLGDVKAQISALNVEKSTYSENLKELSASIDNFKSKNSLNNINLKNSEHKLNKLNEEKNNLTSLVDELLKKQNVLNTNIKDLEVQVNEMSSNILSLGHRKKMLEDMQKEYEGFNGSVKRLLVDAEKNKQLKDKIVGVLASLIKVPSTYQTAIEMALGSGVQNIVTQSDENAKELINYLKLKEYGRVTFLPINTVKPRYFDKMYTRLLNENGVFGLASELVSYDKNISNVVSSLLGTTVVVNNVTTAVNIAKQSGYAFRIVTLEGDIINPQGSITGGSKKAQVANLLSRESDIETLEKNINILSNKKAEKVIEYNELVAKLTLITADLTDKTALLHKSEITYAAEQEVYKKYKDLSNDLENNINKINGEIGKTQQILRTVEDQLNKLSNEDVGVNERNIKSNVSQFSELRTQRDNYNIELTRLKVERAGLEGEILSLTQDKARLQIEIENANFKISEAKQLLSKINEQYEMFSANISSSENTVDVSEIVKELEDVKLNLKNLDENKIEYQAKLRLLEETRMNLSTEINRLQDKKYQQELNMSKIDTELETLQERVWTEYEITYASALPYKQEMFDIKEGMLEINRIKREINKLGHINVNAIEDYKLLSERHGDLYNQAQDLIKAEDDLKKIIKELSNEMLTRFESEFNKINDNFGVVFKELFGGGKARLELVENDDILEAGVDIIAEPPGKKLSNITLLSGGEKALTAIAILFAILRLKPMPFCLLDEIEAALDEANVERFAKYLKRYSNETQFIVITHKKPTMEYSDVLYGVTMEEKGVSKIVSVKLSEAVQNIEQN